MSTHPTGSFVRCDRAWSQDLSEPAWYYIINEHDYQRGGLLLKGCFRPDRPLAVYARCDVTWISEALGDDGVPIVRERVVPADEVPDDVMAAFVKWKLMGEPDGI